jgi:hypothetical protein
VNWARGGFMSVLCSALAAQPAAAQEHFEARHGNVVIEVAVSGQPVAMKTIASQDWHSQSAPVIVRVRGTTPPMTMWATPAYGLVNLPGRHVDVTYLARYRADNDRSDAEPRYSGVPLRPDPRSRNGTAKIDLPLPGGAYLKLVVTVKNGNATTALATRDLAKNVVFPQ